MTFTKEEVADELMGHVDGMKLLHITPEAPGIKSGGQMVVLQTLESICHNNEVDYIGPQIEDSCVANRYGKLYTLSRNDRLIYRIFDLFKGYTSPYYRSWVDLKKKIDFGEYDLVVLEFSKFDFCLQNIPSNKLIVRIHNIEADYAKVDFQMNRSIKKWLVFLIQKKIEKAIAKSASALVFLHEKDADRFKELYGFEGKKYIVPVCVKKQCDSKKEKDNRSFTLLFTGSLWFGANYEGIMWLIKKVLPLVKYDYTLIIAGSKANPNLKEAVRDNSRIELIDSPENMQPLYEIADVVLAPIFDGAGMKVKVAEAFSYCLPVVGTTHAFIGYDIDDGKTSFIADEPKLFAKLIDDCINMDAEDRYAIQTAINELFDKKYSIKCSLEKWNRILDSV